MTASQNQLLGTLGTGGGMTGCAAARVEKLLAHGQIRCKPGNFCRVNMLGCGQYPTDRKHSACNGDATCQYAFHFAAWVLLRRAVGLVAGAAGGTQITHGTAQGVKILARGSLHDNCGLTKSLTFCKNIREVFPNCGQGA